MTEKFGFTNLDALDASEGMLIEACKLGVYNHLICAMVGGAHNLPIETGNFSK